MIINKSKASLTDTEKEEEETEQVMLIAPAQSEPDMRVIGLLSDITEDKLADLIQGFYYLNAINIAVEDEEEKNPLNLLFLPTEALRML